MGLMLAAGVALGDDAPTTNSAHTKKLALPSRGGGDYKEMAKYLKLDDATQLKLNEIAKAKADAVKAYDDAHATEMNDARAAVKKAKMEKDNAGAKDAQAKLDLLTADEKKAGAPFDDAAMALLTPDQKNDWITYKAMKEVEQPWGKIKFTDDQTAQIKTRVSASLTALTSENHKDKEQAIKAVREAIEKEVFTAEQSNDLAASKAAPHGPKAMTAPTAAPTTQK
jgi:hypothetical protein